MKNCAKVMKKKICGRSAARCVQIGENVHNYAKNGTMGRIAINKVWFCWRNGKKTVTLRDFRFLVNEKKK